MDFLTSVTPENQEEFMMQVCSLAIPGMPLLDAWMLWQVGQLLLFVCLPW